MRKGGVRMSKRWQDDPALVEGLAENLVELMAIFPKRMVHVEELVRTYAMPLSHIQILIMLADREQTVGQLSERMGIAKPNMTPLVDSLQAAGLVRRVRSELDKRVVSVRLLPAGEELLCRIRQDVASQVAAWPGAFSRSEAKALSTAAASMIRLAKSMEEGSEAKSF